MASILIVDDELGLQTSLVKAFAIEGYRAVGAGSATEALRLLEGAAFDVLLTDLLLPDLDGIALMERVRQRFPSMVVILMTGGATVESAVRALKGGASDYIVKPFTLVEIFHTAGRALEQQRLKQENVQLNEINRRLQEIDQIKSNLLSAITHEFRTPLTVMHGWLDLLLGNDFGRLTGRQQESLSAVRHSAVRLGRLISNLLVFVEENRGQATRQCVPVSLADLLRDIEGELAPDCAERRVRYQVEIAPGLPTFLADADRLRLVFFNLVENAIKFNEPDGAVLVQARGDRRSLEVTITNTHGEIPAERIPRLLEPFTQGDMSMTRVAGGLGLGLAVARSILDAHGGQLAVESGRGEGTTMRVHLPVPP
ncbi:MAG: hybrid sensor histidine kinase/response regulator [candidate division NC10 bacterium]|nr:hybrid sensor histidine kinase/response regulator [candidate division NC10 bacterium]